MKLFSDRHRPVHLGPYRTERLRRGRDLPDLSALPPMGALDVGAAPAPSVIAAMRDYQAMLDTIRDGPVNKVRAECPEDEDERARHLKAFGHFCDAAGVGICRLPDAARLTQPIRNPGIDRLAADLSTRQTKTLASGIDVVMAELREAVASPPGALPGHPFALVLLYENPREPGPDEPGCDWIRGAAAHRGALRASETATVLADYLRVLGFEARAHSAFASDVDLPRLAVAAGLCVIEDGRAVHPALGQRFGLAAVTTTFAMTPDQPLRPMAEQPPSLGLRPRDPFRRRAFRDGPHPFETLKRVDQPTTFIDEPRVPRVPKRTDMFARALFGDLGPGVQEKAKGGAYVRKSAPSFAQRRSLAAMVLLQDGPVADTRADLDPSDAADLVKATSYWLGIDAVGISRCPDWAWYSHDARGDPIDPPHGHAISMIVDQGYETMEGASGDDWISVAQSMRAYLRFSILGGVIAAQIRALGYSAKAHTVMDGEVLQPPLLLLSGLGEVSRIGEVILNPFLGPRLKSGVVTTDLPMAHDRPVDFGLQRFCEGCNKCARECPSGAITAGPKTMFNGYEIWKSDSQKCATYRITTEGGAMCGRCMKTCPWNLEGIFAERPVRALAMAAPATAPVLQRLDDALGRGGLNPVKKWWWDLELKPTGGYAPAAAPVNARGLQPDLNLRFEDQTLAVYPADLAPPPWPYPFPMDREKGIEAYQAMVTAEDYRRRLRDGTIDAVAHRYMAAGESPVLAVEVASVERVSDGLAVYDLTPVGGGELPEWTAGAHIDVVVAPEYLRQYSLAGDPADRTRFRIGVLREDGGKGGSALLHRIFAPGRRIFVSRPINHFALDPEATRVILVGGGIGITPLLAMAHELHAEGRDFALHYSGRTRTQMAFLDDIAAAPWADRVTLHVSEEAGRADLDALLPDWTPGTHVYSCGGAAFMEAVMAAAEGRGFPEDAAHVEYFTTPDLPDYENHAFTLKLASGAHVEVPADRSAADALIAAGVPVDLKCSDGLCGVCRCGVVSGEVEHRDFVLSKAQRAHSMILCQSRAAAPGGEIEIDL